MAGTGVEIRLGQYVVPIAYCLSVPAAARLTVHMTQSYSLMKLCYWHLRVYQVFRAEVSSLRLSPISSIS